MGLIRKIGSRLRRDAGISVERTYLYHRAAGDPPPPEVPQDVDVRIELLPPAQILERLDDPVELALRIERGDRCYAAWLDDELAHYSWIQTRGTHPITSAGIDVEIQPGDFWIYNCRTVDAHRGKRLYPRTLQYIANECFANGASAGWVYTSSDNIASQHGIVRAGFAMSQTLRALRVGRHYRAA